MKVKQWLAALGVSTILLTTSSVWAATKMPAEATAKIPALLRVLEETEEAVKKGENTEALKEIKEFYELYEGIETQVKAVAAKEHEKIEEHVDEVKKLLAARQVKSEEVEQHLEAIAGELKELSGQEDAAEGKTVDVAAKQKELKEIFEKAEAAAKAGDWNKVKEEIGEFYLGYETIEKQVEVSNREAHEAIEAGVDEIKSLLARNPVSAEKVKEAMEKIESGLVAIAPAEQKAEGKVKVLAELQEKLEAALQAVEEQNWEKAKAELAEFYEKYEVIEAEVKASQKGLHEQIENTLDEAKKLLATSAPEQGKIKEKVEALEALVKQLQDEKAPGEEAQVQKGNMSGIIDSATILLREGFEALLVFAALLAFLRKAGQNDKVKYLYAGAILGVVASFLVAWVFGAAFTANVANREIAEGAISLIAAGMLFYVSYWLISKANAEQWQKYISGQTQASLAQNNVLSLAFVAFLAVFREGFETVLFYAALIPQIGWASAGTGMVIATAALAAVAVAIFVFGMKVPIKPFFTITGVLLYYLAFKFTGVGIHELQEGKVVGETIIPWIPKVQGIGLYPSMESLAAQGLLLAAAVIALIWVLKNKPARN
ncbi:MULTISPECIES: sporulation protein YpjB [unclassified Carboxydocella]|uniref:sporulation protein YpjB n=1 Tax=unclassified Carboxydocella TaxID=2685367 RepID=UPI0009ABE54D|nr:MULTISPECIES: sporulation protein YpjB [unclassified Carboxydocella]GAW28461.1 iron permease [Carboxydocella sp. ULO1]GAW31762.1 iron permease [Carboxydocella sp. JDF658]